MVSTKTKKTFDQSHAVCDRVMSLIHYFSIKVVQNIALLEGLFTKELNQVSHLDLAQGFETDCRPILSFTQSKERHQWFDIERVGKLLRLLYHYVCSLHNKVPDWSLHGNFESFDDFFDFQRERRGHILTVVIHKGQGKIVQARYDEDVMVLLGMRLRQCVLKDAALLFFVAHCS